MARGLLIFLTGMFIVMGIYSLGAQRRILATEQQLAHEAKYVSALFNARSAAEVTAQHITKNPGYAEDNETLTVEFPEGTATVTIQRDGPDYRFTTVAWHDSVSAISEAQLIWNSDALITNIFGSMGIYSNNLNFNISGSAFSIDGRNYFTDGTLNGNDSDILGISLSDGDIQDYILGELNQNQQNQITGTCGPPSVGVVDTDPDQLQQAIELLAQNADLVINSDYTASGAGSLGTYEEPMIVEVKSGTLNLSNATGAGVIIIREDAEIDVRGNLDHYEGIIYVQGAARLVRGNVNIYGAMVFGGEDPELEIDIDLRGNVHIRYSSSALANLNYRFASRAAGFFTLSGVFE